MLLADLEHHVVVQERRTRRPEILVADRVRAREVREAVQRRIELDDALAEVAGAGYRVRVAGRDEDVARRVDRRSVRRPDRAEAGVGRRVERDLAGAGLGERDEPAVVRAAVAGVAAVADVDAAVAEREAGPLLDVERVLARRPGSAFADTRCAPVKRSSPTSWWWITRKASWIAATTNTSFLAVSITGRRRDAERIDVAATDLTDDPCHRWPDMHAPQHPTVVRVERVHRVVLGRGDDAAGGHDRLAVDVLVKVRRPGVAERQQRGFARVVAGVGGVAVILRPRARGTRRRGERRNEDGGDQEPGATAADDRAKAHPVSLPGLAAVNRVR